MTDDLLDYARLRHGQLELVPTAVNLGSLVAGLVEEHHTMAAVPLTVSIADDVPEVCYMDELRLRQVLQNGMPGTLHRRSIISLTASPPVGNWSPRPRRTHERVQVRR